MLRISGILILLIVYRKDRSKIKDIPNCIAVILSLLTYFWVLCFLGLFVAGNILLPLIMVFGYPAAIAAWAIIVRKEQRKESNST